MKKYVVPILLVAIVICVFVVLLIMNLLKTPENNMDADYTDQVVASGIIPAEPVYAQSNNPEPVQEDLSEPPAPITEESEEVQPVGDNSEEKEPDPTEDKASAENTNILQGMITENQDKLERRNTELEDMKSMLSILEEQNNDQKRIELYKDLIAKTEKEINDLENNINRYNSAMKE